MESKFIIYVLFLVSAVAGRSLDAPCAESYGLSKEQSAVVCKILNNAEATLATKLDASNPALNVLSRLAATQVGDVAAETDRAESNLNRRGSWSDLVSIKLTTIRSTYRYQAAVGGVFDAVTKYLSGLVLGIPVAGNDDVAEAETAANFKTGLDVYLDSIVDVDPGATDAAAAVLASSAAASDQLSALHYGAINLARSQNVPYTKALKNLQAIEDQAREACIVLVSTLVEVIRNNNNWDDALEAKVAALKDDATASILNLVTVMYDAIETLLRASRKTPAVSGADLTKVLALKTEGYLSVAAFTHIIEVVRIITLGANSSN